MAFKIGIDVGNYDTKTQHTITPSGYNSFDTRPVMASEYILYEGKYYAPTPNRFEYVKDKTETDQALVLSLFGIAKEIYEFAKTQAGDKPTRELIQSAISEIKEISIGVGLPVGDFMKFRDKTMNYYKERLGNGIFSMEYKNYKYALHLVNCMAFPQDLGPAAAGKDCVTASTFKKYLIIGIGGQTVDVIKVVDKNPIVEECKSFRLGVRRMFFDIIGQMEMNTGNTISEDAVENVLLGEPTTLPDDMEIAIREAAKRHTDKIIQSCVQAGINFLEYPVIFFGGGGLLLRPYLENNKQIQKSEFLSDVCGNAKFYASCLPN